MASLTKDEPVMVTAAATAVIAYVLAILVARGTISSTQASTLTQTLVPFVAAVLPMLAGAFARSKVTPNAHVGAPVTAELVSSGTPGLADADFERLGAVLASKLDELAGVEPSTAGLAPEPNDTSTAPAVAVVPDGMSAGGTG